MKQRRIKRVKEESDNINRDIFEIIKKYKKYTTKKEWIFYLLTISITSLIMFLLISILCDTNKNLLNSINEITTVSLTIVAIITGFNTTSLSVIASSNNKILRFLKSKKISNGKSANDTILQQILVFFSFSMVYGLLILFIGILIILVFKYLYNLESFPAYLEVLWLKIFLLIFGFLWLALILFALVTSIRNASLLYRYVLFVADYEENN
ncbi:hypothetical protein [Bacillus subtilis]|uniref:hypothetical protein n=1 Tax=Bacillus subtilis TaxID=1423 RepID=UPI0002C4E9E7|nr:hypothetical protein [Bacillus subtilis]AGI28474.1 hypothetical protein I653_06090 [Bacillus subtilis subsp. subtilis str. BAB-1]AKD34588.1 hypothetical protein AW03_011960 [Bacillus subtilis HJ5]ALS82645.1 hypothetical protein AT706_12135 [Bacillus subtilis subsp. subtilis]ASK23232.1 hypothetical protein BSSX_1337 [Bacillus subtilis]MCL9625132.1 hypothetical protein [Bacillus subtilis]